MKRFLLPLLILFSIAANSQTIRNMNRKTPARTDSTYLQNGTSQMGTIGDLSDFIQDTSKLTSKASRDKLKDSLQANITASTVGKLSVSDSTIYSTKANYKKGMDSTGALMAAKLALSDSTIYSSKANYKKGADSIGAVITNDTTTLGANARANINATNTAVATNATAISTEATARANADNLLLPKNDSTIANRVTAHTTAISGINSRLQPETQTYLLNILAAGGNIDASTLQAVDRLVTKWKLLTSWSKVSFISPLSGSDMTAALVNLKFPVGLGTLTNNNFVAADYTANKGFYLTSNSSKFLQTGFIGTSQGLSATNYSIGIFVSDPKEFTNWVASDNGASGSVIYFNSASMGSTSQNDACGGWGARSFSFNGATVKMATSSVAALDLTGSNAQSPSTEITYFGTLFSATRSFGTGGLGFAWIGSAMTVQELKDINAIIEEFMRATGRYFVADGWVFFGDSITEGKGLPNGGILTNRYSSVVSKALGLREINLGKPTSEFRQTTSAAIGGYARYPDVNTVPNVSTVSMMYGTNDMNLGDNASNTVADATKVSDLNTKMKTAIQSWQDEGKRVVLLSPPWNGTASAAKQQSYLTTIEDVAKTKKVVLEDMYDAFLDYTYPSNPTSSDLMTSDLIHLTTLGHQVVAQYEIEGARGNLLRKPTIDLPSISAGGTQSTTIHVGSAIAGMTATITPNVAFEAGLVMLPPIVTTDGVILTVYNSTTGAIDPAAIKLNVSVKTNY